MSFDPNPPRRAPARPVLERRSRSALVPTLAVLGVLTALLVLAAEIWTEVLWFSELGYFQVFRTELVTKSLLFVVGALVMAAAVASSLLIGYRSRPVYAPVSAEQQSLDRYRESVEPLRKLVVFAVPAGLGLFAGSASAQQWSTLLLWWNQVPFGRTDAQFGLDIGFFVFTLPWLQFVVGLLTAVAILAGLAALVTHYLYGGLRLQGAGPRTTAAARIHLSVLGGVFVLLQAAGYYLDRYALLTNEYQRITGATYTDVNAVLPAKTVLAGAAVVCALLFFATAVVGNWRLPAAGTALLLVAAIVVGGIYPSLVQRFQVRPTEQSFEEPYIQRNIDATREAYGLSDVEVTPYDASTQAQEGQLRDDTDTVPGIRLLDPTLVSDAYRQLEQGRPYYNFVDVLDVDRYQIDGDLRDSVVAVRELDLSGLLPGQRNWVNDHIVYTHGFGVVAAYGNARNPDGRPAFFQQGIPSQGELPEYQPRIYYGEMSPDYSVVGAPQGARPRELDFPDDESPTGQVNNTYDGEGGVGIGGLFRQLLYAIKFRDQNLVLSNDINSASTILYDRQPRERVEKVAPFLTLDGNPYPTVVGGRVVWIVDGYTTSDEYPYSRLQALDDATTTTLTTQADAVVAQQAREVNYIRNSVKATVDAFDGTVRLYAWDEDDPVLQAWQQVFPDAVQPLSDISGELMTHLRYPEDLFKVQRELLTRYHVEDADAYFSGQDFWTVPSDPTDDAEPPQTPGVLPPYYLTLEMPGQESPSFSLTSPFIPTGTNTRNILTGFLAVDADAGTEAGERREGYGQMRLLELPRDSTVPGPGQAQQLFNQNAQVSQELNLLRQGATEIRNGNLLTLPVGGGLLYVQPVYVEGTGEGSYPLLQKVLVSFGDTVGFANTLDEALDQIFGGDSGAVAGDAGVDPTEPDVLDGDADPAPQPVDPDPADPEVGEEPADPAAVDARGRLADALADANTAIQDGQAALAEGDFTAYGEAQARLQDAINRAVVADAEINATDP